MWTAKFIPEAKKDISKLDGSIRKQIFLGIAKVSTNPLPVPNGYGKPLGNKQGNNLTGFLKIKYKRIGIRVVYTLAVDAKVMNIVAISPRDDEYCYKLARTRSVLYGNELFHDNF